MSEERRQDTDAPEDYLERELHEDTEGLEFVEDPEREFGTGLILPEEGEDMTEEIAAGAANHMRVRRGEDLVAGDDPLTGKKAWRNDRQPYVLSQGPYPACTGFAGANMLNTAPVLQAYGNDTGFELYGEATTLDSVSGRFYPATKKQVGSGGSTGEGIAKALVSLGYSDRVFAVTSSIDTMSRWLLSRGPAILLMPWSGCFKVDGKGYVHPDGQRAGHATLIRGLFRDAEGQVGPNRVTIRNSWGPNWGVKGECRMALADLARVRHTFALVAEAS